MPKQKSNSAAKKRFNVLPSGKIKRGQQGHRHKLNASIKNRKRKNNLTKSAFVFEGEAKSVKQLVQKQN